MVRQGGVWRVEIGGDAFVPPDKDRRGDGAYRGSVGTALSRTVNDPAAKLPGGASIDEAFDALGRPRGAYAAFFDRFDAADLAVEAKRVSAELEAGRVAFGGAEPRPFAVDAVPRLVEAAEWEALERGLIQRVRALNAFLEDAYGERRAVAAGVIAPDLIESAEWFEPAMRDAEMPRVSAHVAGPDLVRGADGTMRVLEDNLRAPSGIAYASAARAVVGPLADRCGLRRAAGGGRDRIARPDAPRRRAGRGRRRPHRPAQRRRRCRGAVRAPRARRHPGDGDGDRGRARPRRRAAAARRLPRRRDLPSRRRRAADRPRRLAHAARRASDRADARGDPRLRQLPGKRDRRRQGDPHQGRGDDRLLPRRGAVDSVRARPLARRARRAGAGTGADRPARDQAAIGVRWRPG